MTLQRYQRYYQLAECGLISSRTKIPNNTVVKSHNSDSFATFQIIEPGHSLECITHTGHSIAFLHFLIL